MRFVCPLLVVEDLERSRDFYCNVLKQTVIADYGENIVFRGDFSLHQRAHFEGLLGNGRAVRFGDDSFELYFETDDLDEIRDRLQKNGVVFVHDLREQPWRQRVMRIADPDGHLIEIGEPMPAVVRRLAQSGMTIAAIAAATSLPERIVLRELALR
ncbi:MAG: glyoxalase/bleomycin resistance/dioxygenase family protein [Myxococcales bacterium]|nr:glyoxalase/bleomycin resistance/dioxygenase family protein [Myxococcales bacterium]